MTKKKYNKLGQGLSVNKIVVVALVLLVILSVFMFLFRADILSYLGNLPGYTVPEDDEEIDLTKLTDEQKEDFCKFRIIGINAGKIYFCDGFDIGCTKKVPSELIWKGSNLNAEIAIDRFFLWGDDQIGTVNGGRVVIFPEFIGGRENLPDEKFLKNLNGAYYSSGNMVCKKELVS